MKLLKNPWTWAVVAAIIVVVLIVNHTNAKK